MKVVQLVHLPANGGVHNFAHVHSLEWEGTPSERESCGSITHTQAPSLLILTSVIEDRGRGRERERKREKNSKKRVAGRSEQSTETENSNHNQFILSSPPQYALGSEREYQEREKQNPRPLFREREKAQ